MKDVKKFFLCIVILMLVSTDIIFFSIRYIQFNYSNVLKQKNDITVTVDSSGKVEVPKSQPKAVLNYRINYEFWIMDTIFSFLIPIIFLLTNIFNVLYRRLEPYGVLKILSPAIFGALYYITYTIAELPILYFASFFKGHMLGSSNQTIARWIELELKNNAVNMLIFVILVFFLYFMMKKSPKRWWLYTGLISLPVIYFYILISPALIDPIFNKFEPLKDEKVKQEVLSVVKKAGIKDCNIYVVNESEDTNMLNAYMTGVLNTKEVVIWDNTIKQLSPGELKAVVAHETGHYVLGHIDQSIVLGALGTLLLLLITDKTAAYFIGKYGRHLGMLKISCALSLPLVLLVINFYSFIFSPVSNAYSRHIETEADRFAIELTRDNYSCAALEVKLQGTNLAVTEPDTIYKLFNCDHPSTKERIDLANNYRPWEKGIPGKYFK